MVIRERFSYKAIHDVLSGLLEQDVHAKRVNFPLRCHPWRVA
jgi:hypothetical protein